MTAWFDENEMRGDINLQVPSKDTLETTQGQIDGFLCQLLIKCYLPEVASVGD